MEHQNPKNPKDASGCNTSDGEFATTFSTEDSGRDAIVCYVFVSNSVCFSKLIGPNPSERASTFAKKIDNTENRSEIRSDFSNPRKAKKREKTRNPIKAAKKFNITEPYTKRSTEESRGRLPRREEGQRLLFSPPWRPPHTSCDGRIEKKTNEDTLLFTEPPSTSTKRSPIFEPSCFSDSGTESFTSPTSLPISTSYICSQCQCVTNDPECHRCSNRESSTPSQTQKNIGETESLRDSILISKTSKEAGNRAPSQCASSPKETKKSSTNNSFDINSQKQEISTQLGDSQTDSCIRAGYCRKCFWRITSSPKYQSNTPYVKSDCQGCEKVCWHTIFNNRFTCTNCNLPTAAGNSFFKLVDWHRKRNFGEILSGVAWTFEELWQNSSQKETPRSRLLNERCISCAILFQTFENYFPFHIKISTKKIQENSKPANLNTEGANAGFSGEAFERKVQTILSSSTKKLSIDDDASNSKQNIENIETIKTEANQIKTGIKNPERYSYPPLLSSRDIYTDKFDRWLEWGEKNISGDDRTIGSECTQTDDISGRQKIFQTIPREDIELEHFTTTDSRIGLRTSELLGSIESSPEGETQRNELPSGAFCERSQRSELGCSSRSCSKDGKKEEEIKTKGSSTTNSYSGRKSPRLSDLQQKTDGDGFPYYSSTFTYPEETEYNLRKTTQQTDEYYKNLEPTKETKIEHQTIVNTNASTSTSYVKFIVEHSLVTGLEKKTEFESDYDFNDYIVGKYYVKMIIKEL